MKELFISYLYRLRRDLAFRITLIIGGGLALILALVYLGLSFIVEANIISGQMMLISSLSPSSNFGLAIPLNLITFTVMEFNNGIIRNKVISGHSKKQIYLSLFLNGLVFTFSLMALYAALCYGLGSLLGLIKIGEEIPPELAALSGSYADFYFLKLIVSAIFIYIAITAFTIFIATLFRGIGPSIPVVLVVIVLGATIGALIASFAADQEGVIWAVRVIDPYYPLGATEFEVVGQYFDPTTGNLVDIHATTIYNETFVSGIISNLTYTALFTVGGLLLFTHRDIK